MSQFAFNILTAVVPLLLLPVLLVISQIVAAEQAMVEPSKALPGDETIETVYQRVEPTC